MMGRPMETHPVFILNERCFLHFNVGFPFSQDQYTLRSCSVHIHHNNLVQQCKVLTYVSLGFRPSNFAVHK
jgi:hypothetical protein